MGSALIELYTHAVFVSLQFIAMYCYKFHTKFIWHHHQQPVPPLLADGLHNCIHSTQSRAFMSFWPLFSISSLHLVFGFPLSLVKSLGDHSIANLANLLSSILATLPAHLFFSSRAVWMTSLTLVLSLMTSFLILSFSHTMTNIPYSQPIFEMWRFMQNGNKWLSDSYWCWYTGLLCTYLTTLSRCYCRGRRHHERYSRCHSIPSPTRHSA